MARPTKVGEFVTNARGKARSTGWGIHTVRKGALTEITFENAKGATVTFSVASRTKESEVRAWMDEAIVEVRE